MWIVLDPRSSVFQYFKRLKIQNEFEVICCFNGNHLVIANTRPPVFVTVQLETK